MKDLYSKLTAVLGKTESDIAFTELIAYVNETPQMYLDSDHTKEYAFNKTKLFLSFFKKSGCFGHAILKAGKFPDELGNSDAELPNGVHFLDDRSSVRRRMDADPERSVSTAVDVCDEYKMDNLLIGFFFTQQNQLWRLSLRYVPAWDLTRNRPGGKMLSD